MQYRHLVDRVRDALASGPPVREVKMFGGLSFMVNEAMVVSVRGDGELLVRVDPEKADQLLTVKGARSAEMGPGRTMSKSWITVGEEGISADEDLDFWMGVALDYNRTNSRAGRRRPPQKTTLQ